ncbi:MAG: excisionase family DNA-binding protein [Deltaproteobacteria bacterium]|jgi:excisionase family DNA binding protein|nr:excisionase family DNA-binding protein [Deltaproteobacteria bacterium]
MASEKDRRLNWQQACQLLGCSKTHFYRLVNSGELQSERFGVIKGVTVKESDCKAYLNGWQERIGEDMRSE